MSFIGAATTIGLSGAAATIGAGVMMGATVTGGMNLLRGKPLFEGIGQGALLGGITGGLFGGAGPAAQGSGAAMADSALSAANPLIPSGMTAANTATAAADATKLGIANTGLQTTLDTQIANTTGQSILDETGRITNFKISPETGQSYYSPPINPAEIYAPGVANPVATNIVSPPPVNPVDLVGNPDVSGVTEPFNANAGMTPSGPSMPPSVAAAPQTDAVKVARAATPEVQSAAKKAGMSAKEWINANPWSSLGLGALGVYGLSSMNQPNTLTATTGTKPVSFYNVGYSSERNPLAGQPGQAPLIQKYVDGSFSPTYSRATARVAGGGMITANMPQSNLQPVMPPNQMIGGSAPNNNQFYPGANIAHGGASYAPPSATEVVGGYDQSINQYTGEPVRMAGGGITYNQDDQTYSGTPQAYVPQGSNRSFEENFARMIIPLFGGSFSEAISNQQRLAAPQYNYNQDDQQYTRRMAEGGLSSFKMHENSDKYATIKDQLMKLTPTQLQLTAEDSDDPIVMGMANDILDFKKGTGTGGFGTTKKSYAAGGIASLGEYAVGGTLLRGGGDGMSDSIPAVIKGAKPQRAALAQGEFVVPADVVSHLGNGSTEAGAQHLYKMMDRVRKARTGNPKQGRQINSARFMPA